MDEKLSLNYRTALPDALRVLLEDYPRTGWTQDAGYNGLIQFWLERHMMFRDLLARLNSLCEHRLDKAIAPEVFASNLAQYGSLLVSELHGHHTIEDHHYFPVLVSKDHRLAHGFELLDSDHHLLDACLQGFVDQANAVLSQTNEETNAVSAFHETVERLSGKLDRHLIDEEELVVPVLLKYGAHGL
jgi:iron-sulfur cluster repair protein YtfE (RIC family)